MLGGPQRQVNEGGIGDRRERNCPLLHNFGAMRIVIASGMYITDNAVNHALDRLLLVFPFCHPDVAGALAHTEH